MENINITEDEMKKCNAIVKKITEYYTKIIVGQKNLQQSLLVALISNGHILVESVPGLAKTTAAKVLTESCGGKFSRIQCTPDLLPSDIVGTQTYNAKTAEFETKIGLVCANFVLLDEINRSSSKTQSAMLEAMQERQVSIGGEIFKLPEIFVVIATQNPIEQEGTYLLSEAQQDRFIIKETITYPTAEEEFEVLNRIENDVFVRIPHNGVFGRNIPLVSRKDSNPVFIILVLKKALPRNMIHVFCEVGHSIAVNPVFHILILQPTDGMSHLMGQGIVRS